MKRSCEQCDSELATKRVTFDCAKCDKNITTCYKCGSANNCKTCQTAVEIELSARIENDKKRQAQHMWDELLADQTKLMFRFDPIEDVPDGIGECFLEPDIVISGYHALDSDHHLRTESLELSDDIRDVQLDYSDSKESYLLEYHLGLEAKLTSWLENESKLLEDKRDEIIDSFEYDWDSLANGEFTGSTEVYVYYNSKILEEPASCQDKDRELWTRLVQRQKTKMKRPIHVLLKQVNKHSNYREEKLLLHFANEKCDVVGDLPPSLQDFDWTRWMYTCKLRYLIFPVSVPAFAYVKI